MSSTHAQGACLITASQAAWASGRVPGRRGGATCTAVGAAAPTQKMKISDKSQIFITFAPIRQKYLHTRSKCTPLKFALTPPLARRWISVAWGWDGLPGRHVQARAASKQPQDSSEMDLTKSLSSSSSSWVHRWFPEVALHYALLVRLDKPIGNWLILWPCFWSITLATPKGEVPDMMMLALFGCGSVILRGVGCTVNDILDRDIDKKVERTKKRPLASGALTLSQGLYFLVFQVLLWFGFLLQLNKYSLILGASFLVLVFTYPLMKRVTYWPQAYLGLAINCGALLGWAAVKESLDPAVILPLYTAGICWTLVYDTIYAHQDKEDDIKVGVKSTALMFGGMTKYWISAFGAACIGSLALTGYNANLAWSYYLFLIAAAAQLAWQISTVNLSNHSDCSRIFVSNKWFGALIFGGVLSGVLLS